MFDLKSKIVCINDNFPPEVWATYDELPQKGSVFTVRDIIPATDYGKGETCAVLLDEVRNTPNAKGVENGFACHRFRKLTLDEELEVMADNKHPVRQLDIELS